MVRNNTDIHMIDQSIPDRGDAFLLEVPYKEDSRS